MSAFGGKGDMKIVTALSANPGSERRMDRSFVLYHVESFTTLLFELCCKRFLCCGISKAPSDIEAATLITPLANQKPLFKTHHSSRRCWRFRVFETYLVHSLTSAPNADENSARSWSFSEMSSIPSTNATYSGPTVFSSVLIFSNNSLTFSPSSFS